MSDRFLASLFAGLIAYMAAMAAGIPSWRTLPIGDATDFGLSSAFLVWFALKALADTHPKDGDVKQAPLVSGAGPKDNAQTGPSIPPHSDNKESDRG